MKFSYFLRNKSCGQRGFSLPEMLASVTVIGILSAIMIPNFMNAKTGSEEIVANEMVETVNLGLKKFNQIAYKITTTKKDELTTDEDEVLALLQTRDVTFLGSPYVRPDWNPIASESAGDYRIKWAGRMFILLKPGTPGKGLKVDFEAGDYN